MINVGVVGLGKMGLSHLSMFRAHPEVNLAGICDSTGYMLSVLGKYTGLKTYSDMNAMLADADLDAVVISTPSSMHASMVRTALDRGLHVFCEKPFCLDPVESSELTALAKSKSLVTQVGYHYRYVGAFQEVKRLLEAGAIGEVTHVLAEAYGPVVLKPQGATWRSTKGQGAVVCTTTPPTRSTWSTGSWASRSGPGDRCSTGSSRERPTMRSSAPCSSTVASRHSSRSAGVTSRSAR